MDFVVLVLDILLVQNSAIPTCTIDENLRCVTDDSSSFKLYGERFRYIIIRILRGNLFMATCTDQLTLCPIIPLPRGDCFYNVLPTLLILGDILLIACPLNHPKVQRNKGGSRSRYRKITPSSMVEMARYRDGLRNEMRVPRAVICGTRRLRM